MPYITIRVTDEQVTREQKQQLITGTTKLLKDVLNKPESSVWVVIEEIPVDNWGVGGKPVRELHHIPG